VELLIMEDRNRQKTIIILLHLIIDEEGKTNKMTFHRTKYHSKGAFVQRAFIWRLMYEGFGPRPISLTYTLILSVLSYLRWFKDNNLLCFFYANMRQVGWCGV
jgi:hypothetical protein